MKDNSTENNFNQNIELVIDRFEGNFAVCERQDNMEMVDIDKNLIPLNAIEGMLIKKDGNKYIIDYENCIVTRKLIIDDIKSNWTEEDGIEYYFVSSVLENAVKCSNIYINKNIYIKDEEIIKSLKKGDIIRKQNDVYIIDNEKNEEIRKELEKLIN